MIRFALQWKKNVLAALKVRWIFSPDVHESIKPSLVYSQSFHCHISTPAKAFRNKSSLSGVELSDQRGLCKYWTPRLPHRPESENNLGKPRNKWE